MPIRQVTVVGTGLIGGSFALAARAHGFAGKVVGCDRPEILEKAIARGVLDEGFADPAQALRGSDLVLLATPVGHIIDFIDRYGPTLSADVLLTDVGSTKRQVVERARAVFGAAAPQRFLAGHPMAGREHSGVEHAQPELFQGAVWLITPLPQQDPESGRPAEYLQLVRAIGARPMLMDAERHDRLCAWISHLPQMLSTAMAASLLDEFGDEPELLAIGGRALREFTRIAASPYSMWRDIAFTNTDNIQEALSRLEQRLAALRDNLRTRGLEEEFERARSFPRPPDAAKP